MLEAGGEMCAKNKINIESLTPTLPTLTVFVPSEMVAVGRKRRGSPIVFAEDRPLFSCEKEL